MRKNQTQNPEQPKHLVERSRQFSTQILKTSSYALLKAVLTLKVFALR